MDLTIFALLNAAGYWIYGPYEAASAVLHVYMDYATYLLSISCH